MHSKWTKFFKNHGRFYILPHDDFDSVMDFFKKEDVIKVIDIGCGTGRHLIPLAHRGFDITGIDYSPAAGQLAEQWLREKELDGKVYIADYTKELGSFKTDEYDAAVAINSLQYIETEEQLNKTFTEINRIVKDDGLVFIVLPSDQSLIIQPDVVQIFIDKTQLEQLVNNYFDVIDLYKDKDKSWVVMARNSTNKEEEITQQSKESLTRKAE